MFWDTKKFNKEIQALPKLLEPGDTLTREELESIKQKVFHTIAAGSPAVETSYFWKTRVHKLIRYAISLVVGVSLVGGTAFASNSSKPGDFLYPIKRVKEKVELSVAVSEEAKADLEIKFAQNRLEELHELAAKEVDEPETQRDESGINSAQTASSSAESINLTSSTTIESASTTPAKQVENKPKNSRRKQLEIRAQVDAQAQVNTAINGLNRLRDKFKAKGDNKAADGVQANILKLKNRARVEHLNVGDDDNKDNGKEEDFKGSENSTSSNQTKLPIPILKRGNGKVQIPKLATSTPVTHNLETSDDNFLHSDSSASSSPSSFDRHGDDGFKSIDD